MSQPPLSSQMKLLETELDCTLFERGSRTIHLTEAGETLYNYSRSLLQLSNVAKQETMNAARHFNGVLRIGIVSSLIGSDALGWLCGFSKQYPTSRSCNRILQQLLDSNLIEEIESQKQEGKGRPTRQYRFCKGNFIRTFF